jgi:hypothetical protein
LSAGLSGRLNTGFTLLPQNPHPYFADELRVILTALIADLSGSMSLSESP